MFESRHSFLHLKCKNSMISKSFWNDSQVTYEDIVSRDSCKSIDNFITILFECPIFFSLVWLRSQKSLSSLSSSDLFDMKRKLKLLKTRRLLEFTFAFGRVTWLRADNCSCKIDILLGLLMTNSDDIITTGHLQYNHRKKMLDHGKNSKKFQCIPI